MKHPDLYQLFENLLADDTTDPAMLLSFLAHRCLDPAAKAGVRDCWEDAVALTLRRPEVTGLFLDAYGRVVSDRQNPDVLPFMAALKDAVKHLQAEAEEIKRFARAKFGDAEWDASGGES